MDTAGLITSWAFNFVPWWLWALAAVMAIGAALIFFGPVLVPIWAAMPTWLKAIFIGLTGGFIVYAVGRNKGSRDERDMQRRREAQAVQQREEIHHDVQKLDRPAVDKRLDRWMRD